MEYKIKSRTNDKIYFNKESKLNIFLYKTVIGRIILKILVLPFISKISGFYMDSKLSNRLIRKFIYKNNIDMNEYEEDNYKCFNEFFIRKIKKGKRPINKEKDILISPCDGKLSVYKISEKNSK